MERDSDDDNTVAYDIDSAQLLNVESCYIHAKFAVLVLNVEGCWVSCGWV
jgi:hypothetical protein